jgi:hypothetical protein
MPTSVGFKENPMASTKKHISFTQQNAVRIESMTKDTNRFSTDVNNVLERYIIMLNESNPHFSVQEWQLCFAVSNSTKMPDDQLQASKLLILAILDRCRNSGDCSRYGVPPIPFIKKLKSLSHAQVFYVIDMCERFHAGDWADCSDYKSIVEILYNAQEESKSEMPNFD